MDPFPAARIILFIVAASYVVSGVLLGVARARGEEVPAWVIATWLVTGVAGLALTAALGPGRRGVWVALLIVLGPWMAWSLVGDLRGGHWVIAGIDVLGLGAIGYALWITAGPAAG